MLDICVTFAHSLHPLPLCFNKLDLHSGRHPIVQGVWQLGDHPAQDMKGTGDQAGCERNPTLPWHGFSGLPFGVQSSIGDPQTHEGLGLRHSPTSIY